MSEICETCAGLIEGGTPFSRYCDKHLDAATCQFCSRAIELEGGLWVDPEATGDDITWRETCDANDTFNARHEPEANITTESKPEQLSAEFWAECLEIREYLVNELDGLILAVGLKEPGSESDLFLEFVLAPANYDGAGYVAYNMEAKKFLVHDLEPAHRANVLIEIPTLGRPALQVSELLRGAVALLDTIE